jgi:hypothetical protein
MFGIDSINNIERVIVMVSIEALLTVVFDLSLEADREEGEGEGEDED